jgi:hypothetical protein
MITTDAVFPVTDVGVTPTTSPVGSPLTLVVTTPVNPEFRVIVSTGWEESVVGGSATYDATLSVIANGPAVVGTVTVSWIASVWFATLAPFPTTVSVVVPAVAELVAVIVRVDVVAPDATDGALNTAVTPAGMPVG